MLSRVSLMGGLSYSRVRRSLIRVLAANDVPSTAAPLRAATMPDLDPGRRAPRNRLDCSYRALRRPATLQEVPALHPPCRVPAPCPGRQRSGQGAILTPGLPAFSS